MILQFIAAYLIVIAILIVAAAIQEWWEWRRENWYVTAEQRILAALRNIVIVAVVALLVLIYLVVKVVAHDHSRPELDGWYKGLTSGVGPCCDGSDHQSVKDPDWESRDGRYRVRIDGQWISVPPEAVLKGPNKDGRTLVWPMRGYMGVSVRCFLPGAMI